MMRTLELLRKEVSRISHALLVLFAYGRTTTAVNDSGLIRTVQGQFGPGQVKDNIPMVQHYGFASNPPVGADFAYGCVNGNRSVAAIIASNHQNYIIKNLGNGSVALYDMFGNEVILSSTGISMTDLTGNSVNMTSGGVHVHSPKSYAYDVNGYGQRITSTGSGNITIDNYTTGATVTTNTHPIDPPAIP